MKNIQSTKQQIFPGNTKIRSIKQRVYDAISKFDEILQGDFAFYEESNGWISIRYDASSKWVGGSLVSLDYRGFDKDNYDREFNENGNVVMTKVYDASLEIIQMTEYFYNEDNLLLTSKHYFDAVEVSEIKKYYYNEDKELIERKLFDVEGTLIQRAAIIYDDRIKLLEMTYNNRGIEVIKKQYFYDENRISKEAHYHGREDSGEYAYIDTTFFDFEERISKIVRYTTWKKRDSDFLQYQYNENCLVKRLTLSGDYIENLEYGYEFNSNNDWIKSIVFRNGVPLAMTVREIEYY